MWANNYIGIPYKPKGRDSNGVDCWGLVRLIYKEQYNIELPSLVDSYIESDEERISELINLYQEGWEECNNPEAGDIVLFRIMGQNTHLGVVINNQQFIHSIQNKNVAVENFTSINWSKRITGYYRYKKQTTGAIMNIAPHPLKTQKFTVAIPPGTNLTQLVDWASKEYDITDSIKKITTIIVNGKVVPKENWNTTILKETDTVEYRVVPEGGDGGFRMFLVLALAIAAPYIVSGLSSVIAGGTFGAGLTSAAVATAMGASPVLFALGTAAVNILGGLLINAIAPIRPPSQKTPDDPEKIYLTTGSRNQLLPYEPIPVVLGKVRMTPPLGAENVSRYQNETESYLDSLLIWGYGPLEVNENSLKIGEIPFAEYTDKRQETLNYKVTPTTIQIQKFDSIYGKDTNSVTPQAELTCEGVPSDAVPPQLAPTPGPWQQASITLPVSDPVLPRNLELAIAFPQGLRRIKSKGSDAGEDYNAPIVFELQWKNNSGSWTSLPELKLGGNASYDTSYPGGYNDDGEVVSYMQKTLGTDSVKKDGFVWYNTYELPPLDGIVTVRIRRLTGDDTSPEGTDFQWVHSAIFQTMKVITNRKPVVNPPGCVLARTALTIKATNQLNGNLEGFNAIVQTYCKSWVGSSATNGSWEYRATSNPADLFRYILTHPANPRRILEAEVAEKINLEQIQYWALYCNNRAVPFQYNAVEAGGRSIMEILRDICASGRASPTLVDGRWTVVIDEPKTVTVQHFTPHNSWGFESNKIIPQLPHAFRANFINEDKNYEQDEVMLPLPGYTTATASLFETIDLPGVTKESLVIDHLKWHVAQLKLRPEVYTLNTDIEYIVCNRGDRVKVSHDVPLWGLGSGRIKDIVAPGYVYDLDEQLYIDVQKDYNIRVRSSQNRGQSTLREVQVQFNFSQASKDSTGLRLEMQESHSIQPGDLVDVISNFAQITGTDIVVLDVVGDTLILESNLEDFNPINWTGTVKLTTSNYTRIKLSPVSTVNQINIGDLFIFGEINKESQDLIVLGIEPLDNKNAKITLVDYGVATNTGSSETDYNIFEDYLSLSTNIYFNTGITISSEGTRNLYKPGDYPFVLQVFSGPVTTDSLSPGTFVYNIKVAYTNLDNLSKKTKFVECQYNLTASASNNSARSIIVPYEQGIITIPGVIENRSYRVRLRYLTEDGIGGPWTIWYTHLAQGFIDNNNLPLQISIDRITRYLEITPYIDTGDYIPPDFKTFEYRIYKNAGNPAEDFWDTVPVSDPNMIVTYSAAPVRVNLRDFTPPRLSLAGVQYRIACRVVTVANKYSSSSALASVVITSLI